MKSVKTIFISFLCLIIWGEPAPLSLLAKGKVNTPFSGKVIDTRNKKGLANVSVSFEGTNIANLVRFSMTSWMSTGTRIIGRIIILLSRLNRLKTRWRN